LPIVNVAELAIGLPPFTTSFGSIDADGYLAVTVPVPPTVAP
jgi:hypothetical protein